MKHIFTLPALKLSLLFFFIFSSATIGLSTCSNEPNSAISTTFVKYNELLESDVIILNGSNHVSLYEGYGDGKRLTESNGDPYSDRIGLFRIKFIEGKGYTIAPVKDETKVICTSRSDYTSDADYKKPDRFLWLYTMLNGGNQFWNIQKSGNAYLIQNTNSSLYIGYDAKNKYLIQTTIDKACKYTFSRQGSVVNEPVQYNEVIGVDMVFSSGAYAIDRKFDDKNGSQLIERNGDPSWMGSGLFKVEFHAGKG